LREGRALSDDEFDDLFDEDRSIVKRTSRWLQRLNKRDDFDCELLYYSGIPVFWSYVLDEERIFVGNLAMNRFSARLPVSVLVKDDPRTRTLYRYYGSAIEGLTAAAKQPRPNG
jgi:hypothetical protein